MKLCQSPDFRDAIQAASGHFAQAGLSEQLIEKDYYVTESLRIVATQYPAQVIFKGGTSLSKGWKLIERFSEDIDLCVNREAFHPPLSGNQSQKTLKAIEQAVGEHYGLTIAPGGLSNRGIWRKSYFEYPQLFSGIAAVANRILLEMGVRSGTHPTEEVYLSSYLAEFLRDNNQSLGAEDEHPFPMKLLHFRRTFVEKLFTIHSKVMEGGPAVGAYARHYYDLYCLIQEPAVTSMLEGSEYREMIKDCDLISQRYFSSTYHPTESLVFSNSPALFPVGESRRILAREYKQQCENLCYGTAPEWDEVEACFLAIRAYL